ncbi:hypothetical protein CKO27_16255 [Thiocystis violacea]|nr:hypothetical protein [Thiocystis violacea]
MPVQQRHLWTTPDVPEDGNQSRLLQVSQGVVAGIARDRKAREGGARQADHQVLALSDTPAQGQGDMQGLAGEGGGAFEPVERKGARDRWRCG